MTDRSADLLRWAAIAAAFSIAVALVFVPYCLMGQQ